MSTSSLTKTRDSFPLIDPFSFELDSLLLVDDPEACEPGREVGNTRMDFVDLSPGICVRSASYAEGPSLVPLSPFAESACFLGLCGKMSTIWLGN